MSLSDLELVHGRDEPPSEPLEVRAGPLVAALDGIALRWIRLGGTEVLRGVYPAIRDEGWGTLETEILWIERQVVEARFTVVFEARSRQEPIDVAWGGRIEGAADGTISYSFHGRAESAFRYGRIGLNILHPPSAAGRPFRGEAPTGQVSGHLPTEIGPQLCVDGVFLGLFPPVTSLTVEVADGLDVHTVFEGDLFEMEDQRNWTDASFKTYSTPLALGLSHEAERGRTFSQAVRLSARARQAVGATRAPRRRAFVELGETLARGVPALGLGLPEEPTPPTDRERMLLRALALDHLRADLRPRTDGWEERLEAASDYAHALDIRLELALHLPAGAARSLEPLARAPLARVLVFAEDRGTTPGRLVVAVRDELRGLGVDCPVGGGTDVLFADLNRERPDGGVMDVVCYPINPQMHAFDDASIMETPPIQGLTVETARSWSEDGSISVTPVTLRPRPDPDEASAHPTPPGELPGSVDHRQASLLCAAWTVASLASLSYAGAASVTYFETVGWRGVLEPDQLSPRPERFRSEPGTVFPVYHVFATIAPLRGGVLVDVATPAEPAVGVLAVQTDETLRALIANLTPRAHDIELAPLPAARAGVRLLDEAAARTLMRAPETLAFLRRDAPVSKGKLHLELPPYALAIVDAASPR